MKEDRGHSSTHSFSFLRKCCNKRRISLASSDCVNVKIVNPFGAINTKEGTPFNFQTSKITYQTSFQRLTKIPCLNNFSLRMTASCMYCVILKQEKNQIIVSLSHITALTNISKL